MGCKTCPCSALGGNIFWEGIKARKKHFYMGKLPLEVEGEGLKSCCGLLG
jgi:hypothetical protein